MPEKNKYCCSEHIDISFDDFILDNETFPYLISTENHKCTYCNKEAKYILKLKP
ncbi:CxxH/CxxC protein [Clostridium sp. BJN0013]|uniref:CxxH/CxxC protein n=1 Tax=Clostridium sp. BJN0013 TaxID=3236840 RepID=UPI0034C6D156